MRLISWNVNGIRSCQKKGFLDWLKITTPEVVCLQEVRALPEQLDEAMLKPSAGGRRKYHTHWVPAERKGYSGVATLSLEPAELLAEGLGDAQFDVEGRIVATRHGDITVVNGYFPNGQRDLGRVPYKLEFTRKVLDYADALRADGHLVVVCGDFNTAHHEIDLRNWRGNRKATGFLPEERAELDVWLDRGWRDSFRALHPGEANRYTWWSHRPGVREKNVGWRIDYHMVAPELWDRVLSADILAEVRGSDHCPIQLTLRS